MKFFISVILFASVSMITAQRGSYAGSGPIVSGLRQPYNNDISQRAGDQYAVQPFWFHNAPAINAHLNHPQPAFGQPVPQLNYVDNFRPGTFVGGR